MMIDANLVIGMQIGFIVGLTVGILPSLFLLIKAIKN